METVACWLQTWITIKITIKNEGMKMAIIHALLSGVITICMVTSIPLLSWKHCVILWISSNQRKKKLSVIIDEVVFLKNKQNIRSTTCYNLNSWCSSGPGRSGPLHVCGRVGVGTFHGTFAVEFRHSHFETACTDACPSTEASSCRPDQHWSLCLRFQGDGVVIWFTISKSDHNWWFQLKDFSAF